MTRPTEYIESLPAQSQAGIAMLELLAMATGTGLPTDADRERMRELAKIKKGVMARVTAWSIEKQEATALPSFQSKGDRWAIYYEGRYIAGGYLSKAAAKADLPTIQTIHYSGRK